MNNQQQQANWLAGWLDGWLFGWLCWLVVVFGWLAQVTENQLKHYQHHYYPSIHKTQANTHIQSYTFKINIHTYTTSTLRTMNFMDLWRKATLRRKKQKTAANNPKYRKKIVIIEYWKHTQKKNRLKRFKT